MRTNAAINHQERAPRWMRLVLVVAGAYNIAWGAATVLFPVQALRLIGVPLPESEALWPQFWQCIGMIVGVYGVGYLAASRDPFRHWPITLVGLLGKIFGPIGFLDAAVKGLLPWSMGWTIVTNDLIWWGPFAMILLGARRHSKKERTGHDG